MNYLHIPTAKIGRKFFCSLKCYGVCQGVGHFSEVDEKVIKNNRKNIKNYSDNRRDDLSCFRYFLFRASSRFKKHKETRSNNITAQDLLDLWVSQNGICPFTGWRLELPLTSNGWKTPVSASRASLDRKDNSKGYEKGNVRFVSYMANIARGTMTDEELIRFCNAVVENKNKNSSCI